MAEIEAGSNSVGCGCGGILLPSSNFMRGEREGRNNQGGSGAPAAAGDGFRNPTDSFQIPTLPFKNTQQKEGGREGESVSGE